MNLIPFIDFYLFRGNAMIFLLYIIAEIINN